MIAQKQESSVQFRRLIDAIVAPAAVWPLVVAAAFLSPRGWPLGDATARNARRSPPASDGVAIASTRRRSPARLSQKSLSRML